MTAIDPNQISTIEVVLPCPRFDETLAFFTGRLGFRVEAIFPADAPSVAVLDLAGMRIRLERDAPATADAGTLRLLVRDPAMVAGGPQELVAPNNTRVLLVPAEAPVALPPLKPSLVVTRAGDAAEWRVGRAGMRYRDLIPDRQGGRFIASHIRIPDAGPVPDYVHFHKVRFQMIFCRRGWARLVYEDQGEPFLFEAGDCVLQPPGIRHRVLESSAGLEVVEIGSPALHETFADATMALPTPAVNPRRDFDGQRFVWHRAAAATWGAWRLDGFVARDTGIAAATGGLATARVVRRAKPTGRSRCRHDAELMMLFVLQGSLMLQVDGRAPERLAEDDSVCIPAGLGYGLDDSSSDLEFLEVALPAGYGLGIETPAGQD